MAKPEIILQTHFFGISKRKEKTPPFKTSLLKVRRNLLYYLRVQMQVNSSLQKPFNRVVSQKIKQMGSKRKSN